MKQVRIGDITIDAVIERDGPWRRPQDFFPAYDEAVFKHHLPSMEPEVFDAALGMMVITYQTFVVRTPHHTILVDTCTGEDKGHPPPFDFPGKERWRNELFALGITYDKVDYVFCTHLHIDHTGWNTTLRDGRWVPTFPNAKYVFHKKEYAVWEAEHARGADPPGTVFRDNCLPIVEAGQALLVDDDYALDDTITLDADAGALALPLLRQHFLARAARGGDRRHDAPRDPVPRARLVAAGRLGWQAGGGVAPEVFVLGRGNRYADPADPFPDTDGRPGHGGRGAIQLPFQTRELNGFAGKAVAHPEMSCSQPR